ncbi:hypothetical protein HPB48_001665 [Haemaphysalis longicornis]|uniref:Uncharacterized protein n=1 Tax=Haemaphysalis longicornis TaxID=44386 RepID=A0A9J6FBP9_HAELO|nr:hypothetical protein HPB48_001665 [Haemaphysalis longicornis]
MFYLCLICRNSSAPGFYGLLKIHKPGVPFARLYTLLLTMPSTFKFTAPHLRPPPLPLAGKTPDSCPQLELLCETCITGEHWRRRKPGLVRRRVFVH